MIAISAAEKTLLDLVQQDMPLRADPFAEIGTACGLSEADTIDKIRALVEAGLIREISAIFDAAKIGYKSTLVAAQVGPAAMDTLSARINGHPGVSHNYLRDYAYNMWFTLTIARKEEFRTVIDELLDNEPISYLILPAIRVFKIRMQLDLSGGPARSDAVHTVPSGPAEDGDLSSSDRALVVALQDGIEIQSNPWQKPADSLGITVQELFSGIGDLKRSGALRRISAVLRHRKAGFTANGMACFRIAENAVAAAGKKVAQLRDVSHCYQRQTRPGWEYTLFAMVHGRSREYTDSAITEMARQIDCSDYLVLYSERELKKERVKYFREWS